MSNQEQHPLLLLVDDSPAIHRLLAFKLRNEAIELISAYDGSEGLESAQRQMPSLVLLDLNMPGMHGLEVLKALKSDESTHDIPVIVLSGSAQSKEKVQAFELGAMDFVTKPFDLPELRARIGSAIRLHRLMVMLGQRAQIDGLTGLWNRKYFDERLESEVNESLRGEDKPVSLAMCDLDHFKKLNDGFGHPAGDAVLESFAKILSSTVRSYDIACRYGGEEFALIFPGTEAHEAAGVCERIRKAIEEHRWSAYPDIRATASFGLASIPLPDVAGPTGWLEAADQALYSAKTNGRNRIHAHDGSGNFGELPELKLAG